MVQLEAGWSDLGSWAALWEHANRDQHGNAVTGPAEVRSVSSSYVAAADRPVLVLGLEGVVVVDSGKGILVTALEHAQDVMPPKDPRRGAP